MVSSEHRDQPTASEGEAQTAAASTGSDHGPALGDWWLALAVAGFISWGLYSFPAHTWRVPDRLADVSAMSPQSEQDELAAVELANLWKNTLFRFTWAGLGWGTIGGVLCRRRVREHWKGAVGTLLAGAVCGAVAGIVGLKVRQYFNLGYPIPLINEENRSLVADSLVMAVSSAILMVPVSLLIAMQKGGPSMGAVWAPPLAGVLTGFVAPLVIAIAFAEENTSIFPPESLIITSVWYLLNVTLAGILIVRSASGARLHPVASDPSSQASAEESA